MASREMPRRLFDGSREYVIADKGVLPLYDGSKLVNVKPASTKIFFTSENSEYVIWDQDKESAVFSHGLNCVPVVTVWDSDGLQLSPEITMLGPTSFRVDFGYELRIVEEHPWYCVINYGGEYGDEDDINDSLASSLAQAQENAIAAEEARQAAIAARNQALIYAEQARQAYEAANRLALDNTPPKINAIMQYSTIKSTIVDTETGLTARIAWSDPQPYAMSYGEIFMWGSTLLVINHDHLPTSVNDGTLVIENTEWNAHSTHATGIDVPLVNDIVYFRLFTKLYNGVVSEAANSPGRDIVNLTIESLDDFMDVMREGKVNALKSVCPVGSTLQFVNHEGFGISYFIGAYDYTGRYDTVEEYLDDETRSHNVILVPSVVPSNASGNRIVVPYDLIEKMTALSADTEFVDGKTYYTNSGCTVQYDTSGAGAGDTPVSLKLYEKGRVLTSNGYGRYSESFIRQWLTSDEPAGQWYEPLNVFEPATHAFATTYDGYLRGFSQDVRKYLHPARNQCNVYNNTFDICYDSCFLPSKHMLMRANENNLGMALEYFRNQTLPSGRIFRDPNGTAIYAWTCTQDYVLNNPSVLANISTEGAMTTAGKLEGGTQQKDCAVPLLCLA